MSEQPIKLFISHASEDKHPFVEQLYNALKATSKYEVWYDTDSLHLGGSITFEISDALNNCLYALVILSPIYITKKWCKREYVTIVHLESGQEKIMLPIWHNINEEQVKGFDASLMDRPALRSTRQIDDIVTAINTGTWTGQKAREVGDPLRKEYSELADALAEHDANERLSQNGHGVMIVAEEVSHLLDVFLKRLDQVKGSMQFQAERRNQPVYSSPYCPAVLASGRFRVNVEIGYLNADSHVTSYAKLIVTLFAWPDETPPMLAAVFGKREELLQKVFTPRFTINGKVQWKDLEDASIHTSEDLAGMVLTLFKEEIQRRLDHS
jgi:hypothetical protein